MGEWVFAHEMFNPRESDEKIRVKQGSEFCMYTISHAKEIEGMNEVDQPGETRTCCKFLLARPKTFEHTVCLATWQKVVLNSMQKQVKL